MSKITEDIFGRPSVFRLLYSCVRKPQSIPFVINMINLYFLDKKMGTDFHGRLYWDEISTDRTRANDYSGTPKKLISTLKKLKITDSDSIMDMGSGKGLAMWYMSQFPFNKIGGIELSEYLCSVAKANLQKLVGSLDRYQVICGDAGAGIYDDYNFFYIYNSFPKGVVSEVANRLHESALRHPRRLVVMYLYPEYPREMLDGDHFVLVKKESNLELRNGMHIFVNKGYEFETIFR